jgi:hypothetical protein
MLPLGALPRTILVIHHRVKEHRMTTLAFSRLLGAAYRFTWVERRRVVALALPWLAAAALPALLLEGLSPRSGLIGAALALIGLLIAVAGFLGFALRWQRHILAGERLAGRAALAVGRRERRFAGHAVLVFIVVGVAFLGAAVLVYLPLTLAISALHARALAGVSGWLFQGVAAVACGTVFGRLALALPATAVDESGDMLEIAWQRSRGNVLGLFLGTIGSLLPFALLQHLIEAPFGRLINYHLVPQLAASALAMILGFAALAVLASFLAEAYRALAPAGVPKAGVAPSGALSAR